MKYRIVKETYRDNTNRYYVQQKRFLFWGPVDSSSILSDVDHCDFFFPAYYYKLFNSHESAKKALNEHIKETQDNILVKTEVVSTFKSK